jgi:V-type H+-transporting ATPase subunit E|eukprot:Transcript_12722.p1 GENE.Transcript_12722~~Transcript_12722.p1  ORF type:complete len:221 (+),score=139.95 Transcript_12722:84-746(+)
MDESQVNQQIDQMVRFIQQEASEKAAEIKLKADEEFNIEKLRMVEAEKQKIRQEYERKEKQVEVSKRIQQSNEIRYSRLKCLKARDDAMQDVLKEAAAKLPALATGAGYATLLESLILEALISLAETKVTVKGVQGQSAVVQKCLTPATAKYKDWASKNKDAAFVSAIDISFDSAPLPVGIGGVEVTGFGGKINLNNTLQSRLMLAYETRLPALRALLFD